MLSIGTKPIADMSRAEVQLELKKLVAEFWALPVALTPLEQAKLAHIEQVDKLAAEMRELAYQKLRDIHTAAQRAHAAAAASFLAYIKEKHADFLQAHGPKLSPSAKEELKALVRETNPELMQAHDQAALAVEVRKDSAITPQAYVRLSFSTPHCLDIDPVKRIYFKLSSAERERLWELSSREVLFLARGSIALKETIHSELPESVRTSIGEVPWPFTTQEQA